MNQIVGVTEAAFLLNISPSRVRVLLRENRVKGATKECGVWKIPLFKGMPKVAEKGSGLKGTWRKRACKVETKIHVNKPKIDSNRKNQTYEPVITVRQGSRTTYCHMAEIKGECRIVYRPHDKLPCKAVVWIEVLPDTLVIPQLFEPQELKMAKK